MSADIHGLSGAYAVDALDARERRAFEAHLAQCAECQREVAGLRAAAAELSHLSAATPPASLRQAVLAGAATIRPLPPRDTSGSESADTGGADPKSAQTDSVVVPLAGRRRLPATWLIAAAAAVVFALGGLVWGVTRPEPEPPITAAQRVLQAQDAQRFEQTVDGARATIVRSPSLGRAVLIADNMPPAPEGHDFQLWLDQPGRGMVSAGVMPHEAAPTLTVVLDGDAATATGAGITLEPAGGSPAPTSEPIALFAFS